jgi:hypothetical protein
MEYASYLSGERWSDHPSCTHPAVASLARMVNDLSSDAARGELVPLIPSVIGLVSEDPRVSLGVAIRAGVAALPVASFDRQRALASGLLCCEYHLAALEAAPSSPAPLSSLHVSSLHEQIEAALAMVPDAASWARAFTAAQRAPKRSTAPQLCEAMLRTSAIGIAEACIDDADLRLRDLLTSVIAEWTFGASTMAPTEAAAAGAEAAGVRHQPQL